MRRQVEAHSVIECEDLSIKCLKTRNNVCSCGYLGKALVLQLRGSLGRGTDS